MRMQDLYPFYDSAILGLNGIYSTVGNDSFYVKSPCIKAVSHTITTGHTYLFKESNGIVKLVELYDGFHDNQYFHLFLVDVKSKKRFSVSTIVDGYKHECSWMLIDLEFLQEQVDNLIANAYCESE
jgi:hypothetical protein